MTVPLWALVLAAVAAGVVGGLVAAVGLAVYGGGGRVSGGVGQGEDEREVAYREAQERYREQLRRLEQEECR